MLEILKIYDFLASDLTRDWLLSRISYLIMSHFYMDEQSSLIFMCSHLKSFPRFVDKGAEVLEIQCLETLI